MRAGMAVMCMIEVLPSHICDICKLSLGSVKGQGRRTDDLQDGVNVLRSAFNRYGSWHAQLIGCHVAAATLCRCLVLTSAGVL